MDDPIISLQSNIQIWILILIIIGCGILGGFGGYLNQISNPEVKKYEILKYLIVGTISSATVPLFLTLVQSNLLINAGTNPLDYFVIVGMCLIAGYFSQRFLKIVSDRFLQEEIEKNKQKIEAVQADTKDMKEVTDSIIANNSDDNAKDLKAADPIMKINPENIRESQSELLKTFINRPYTFRTVNGLSKETGLKSDEIASVLEEYANRNLLKQYMSSEGKKLYSLTTQGRALIKEDV